MCCTTDRLGPKWLRKPAARDIMWMTSGLMNSSKPHLRGAIQTADTICFMSCCSSQSKPHLRGGSLLAAAIIAEIRRVCNHDSAIVHLRFLYFSISISVAHCRDLIRYEQQLSLSILHFCLIDKCSFGENVADANVEGQCS